jgi:hypothetical protein
MIPPRQGLWLMTLMEWLGLLWTGNVYRLVEPALLATHRKKLPGVVTQPLLLPRRLGLQSFDKGYMPCQNPPVDCGPDNFVPTDTPEHEARLPGTQ